MPAVAAAVAAAAPVTAAVAEIISDAKNVIKDIISIAPSSAKAGIKYIPGTNPPIPSTGDTITDEQIARTQQMNQSLTPSVANSINFTPWIIGGLAVATLITILVIASGKK